VQDMDGRYYISVSRINFYGRVYVMGEGSEIGKRLRGMYCGDRME
jgi:hypothetical protein